MKKNKKFNEDSLTKLEEDFRMTNMTASKGLTT